QVLGDLLAEEIGRRPELLALKERVRTAEHRIRAANTLNYPVLQVVGSAGDTEHISNRPNLQEDGWWGVGGVVSVPLCTGFLIQHQVAEATAAETRLAETQYNAKIAEARLRYAIGGL